MSQTHFSITIEISSLPSHFWSVMTDVERWPEWTPSVSRIKLLTPAPLRIGSRVRIHQPKLPPATWRVTEWDPSASFTWVNSLPGLRVTARHLVQTIEGGSRVTLSIDYEGLFGPLLAMCTHALTERYLRMEADGLSKRCFSVGAAPLNGRTLREVRAPGLE